MRARSPNSGGRPSVPVSRSTVTARYATLQSRGSPKRKENKKKKIIWNFGWPLLPLDRGILFESSRQACPRYSPGLARGPVPVEILCNRLARRRIDDMLYRWSRFCRKVGILVFPDWRLKIDNLGSGGDDSRLGRPMTRSLSKGCRVGRFTCEGGPRGVIGRRSTAVTRGSCLF